MDKTGTSTLLCSIQKHKCTIFPFFNIKQGWVKTHRWLKKIKYTKPDVVIYTHKENEGSEKKNVMLPPRNAAYILF